MALVPKTTIKVEIKQPGEDAPSWALFVRVPTVKVVAELRAILQGKGMFEKMRTILSKLAPEQRALVQAALKSGASAGGDMPKMNEMMATVLGAADLVDLVDLYEGDRITDNERIEVAEKVRPFVASVAGIEDEDGKPWDLDRLWSECEPAAVDALVVAAKEILTQVDSRALLTEKK